MSAVGLVFYFVFGGNLLLEWGLPGYKPVKPSQNIQNAVLLIVITIFSTLVNGSIFRYVLMPFGLETLMPLTFVLILSGIYAILNIVTKATVNNKTPLSNLSNSILPLSLVLYVAAMATAWVVGSPLLLVLGGLSAALGYLAASVLLDDIVNRLLLEPVPEAFKGAPIRLMSAGLIALTFAGIDVAFMMKIT